MWRSNCNVLFAAIGLTAVLVGIALFVGDRDPAYYLTPAPESCTCPIPPGTKCLNPYDDADLKKHKTLGDTLTGASGFIAPIVWSLAYLFAVLIFFIFVMIHDMSSFSGKREVMWTMQDLCGWCGKTVGRCFKAPFLCFAALAGCYSNTWFWRAVKSCEELKKFFVFPVVAKLAEGGKALATKTKGCMNSAQSCVNDPCAKTLVTVACFPLFIILWVLVGVYWLATVLPMAILACVFCFLFVYLIPGVFMLVSLLIMIAMYIVLTVCFLPFFVGTFIVLSILYPIRISLLNVFGSLILMWLCLALLAVESILQLTETENDVLDFSSQTIKEQPHFSVPDCFCDCTYRVAKPKPAILLIASVIALYKISRMIYTALNNLLAEAEMHHVFMLSYKIPVAAATQLSEREPGTSLALPVLARLGFRTGSMTTELTSVAVDSTSVAGLKDKTHE